MKILDRYLAAAVLQGTGVTFAVLLPLLGVVVLADESDQLGVNQYGLTELFAFTVLTLPRYGYQLFPIATLIGALVGLGMLASRSELVAMRAAGVSIRRIALGGLSGGLGLAVLALLLGEVVVPAAEQQALVLRSTLKTGQALQITASGLWARDGAAVINIRSILPGALLQDIYLYEIDGTRLRVAAHARQAQYRGGSWELEDIQRSHISDTGVEVEQIEQASWTSLLNPEVLKVIVVEPQLLPISGLIRTIDFLHQSQQDATSYELALWAKIVHPVLVLMMIFVALPVLFGTTRSTGLGLKIFLGVMIGVLFYLVSRTLAYLALLYSFSPMLAAWLPPLAFLGGAVLILRRH